MINGGRRGGAVRERVSCQAGCGQQGFGTSGRPNGEEEITVGYAAMSHPFTFPEGTAAACPDQKKIISG